MKIGVPKETFQKETRVAMIPAIASTFIKDKHEVFIETDAGQKSTFTDAEYQKAGAIILNSAEEIYKTSDIILKIQPPTEQEVELMKEGSILIGSLAPLDNLKVMKMLADKKIMSFSTEYIPRITRAQSMDTLSSMATIVGYKAVLISATHIGKFFPLLMTAAGTIAPATVLVLGAGVAGLQAIATAKRIGAKVEAFDPRSAVKEQIHSLGASFVEMELVEDAETKGGYAKEMSDEFLKKEREAIASRLTKTDIVITTAQIFGKKAPILITEEMVKMMRQGSIIIDITAGQGGNCVYTKPDEIVEVDGVTIFGYTNLATSLPVHASQMFSKNMLNFFKNLYPNSETKEVDFEDEINKASCITKNGEILNSMIKDAFEKRGGI